MQAAELTPAHLRMPEGWDRLRLAVAEARRAGKGVREALRRVSYASDPPPGKTGIVRDRSLRHHLRLILQEGFRSLGLSGTPDEFTTKDLQRLLEVRGPLRSRSGVPIDRVTLLWSIRDPVRVPRRSFDYEARQWRVEPKERASRVYDSQNNHHIEIRQDEKGIWRGVVVRAFDAVAFARIHGGQLVDRSDDPARGGVFVMALAQGETIRMRHPKQARDDYFVLFKIDPSGVMHFASHADARPATTTPRDRALQAAREGVALSPRQLQAAAPEGEQYPYKVIVSALGEARRAERD
jgi:hypothetical protein